MSVVLRATEDQSWRAWKARWREALGPRGSPPSRSRSVIDSRRDEHSPNSASESRAESSKQRGERTRGEALDSGSAKSSPSALQFLSFLPNSRHSEMASTHTESSLKALTVPKLKVRPQSSPPPALPLTVQLSSPRNSSPKRPSPRLARRTSSSLASSRPPPPSRPTLPLLNPLLPLQRRRRLPSPPPLLSPSAPLRWRRRSPQCPRW